MGILVVASRPLQSLYEFAAMFHFTSGSITHLLFFSHKREERYLKLESRPIQSSWNSGFETNRSLRLLLGPVRVLAWDGAWIITTINSYNEP